MNGPPRLGKPFTQPYDPVKHRHYLQAYATRGYCRDCVRPDKHGRRVIRLLGDHVTQTPMLCPECKRVWVYWVDQSREVKHRRAWCLFPNRQPFLMSDLPRHTL